MKRLVSKCTYTHTHNHTHTHSYMLPQLIPVILKFSHSQCPSIVATVVRVAAPARPNDDVPCRRNTGTKHTSFGHSNNLTAVRLIVVDCRLSYSFWT